VGDGPFGPLGARARHHSSVGRSSAGNPGRVGPPLPGRTSRLGLWQHERAHDLPLRGMLLPDPWSTGLTPYPARALDPYYRFVRYFVQEHTNPGARPSKFDMCKFLWFMLIHGLSPSTIRAVARQLWSERSNHDSWKRAVILDLFQWDVFR